MSQTYRVTGMTCQGCANAVSNAITQQAPGARALVDLKAGTVSVEGPLEESAVRKAVEGAGFDFGGAA
ncbi:heavy-metal-associated domain-containing protein [Aerophototrophica crusticola]|uniref:Heavy-metal-associated domain-containing protein n=1 Tax=Aerophototrophica crusticola TaxID=1709002 RepID=A0A858R606_9PROT|nr:heavy-metal-associated domain-containing protein [Rhodospirillaceae bacterium B3]